MKKKCLVVGVILLFIGLAFAPSITASFTKKSEKQVTILIGNGNTLYVGGDGPGNYTRIQDAVDDASDGDTVFVYDDSSPYYENVIINKSINLIGENKDTTIIDGSKSGDGVDISADSVTLSGFTIQNATRGIRLRGCNGYTLSNNIITSNSFGISSAYCSDNTLSENIVSNNENDAVSLQDLKDSIISGNIVTNNGGDGISIHSRSYSNLIFDNIVVGNDKGICLSEASNNIVSSNTITSNSVDGIYLQFSSGNTISKNDIEDTDYYGISVGLSSDNNTLYHNNFKNNTQNAYDECDNIWDSGYWSGGNYWDDYIGDDFYHGDEQNKLGQDWRGDTPYNIAGGSNQDRYPLILQYESEPPFAIIEHPSDGLITSEHNVTIIGYITDNVGLVKSGTIYGSEWEGVTVWSESLPPYELTPKLDFDFIVELKPGWNEIGIHATDPSDNYGEDSVLVYYYPDIVYVDDDYNSSTQGWQQYCFNSIQDGVDAVAESGTVYVYNGMYYENIIVDKSINLIGEDKNATIIDGQKNTVVKVTEDNVTIAGFSITNASDFPHMGIWADKVDGCIFSNNIVYSNYYGIELYGSNSQITNNIIYSNMENGIYIPSGDFNTITNNIIHSNNNWAIYLYNSPWNQGRNSIINNSISDNYGGIKFQYSSNNTINLNTIENSTEGIKLLGGIHPWEKSINNVIYHNNFINNTQHAFDECNNTWDNGYPSCGNYWDDYIGEDNDGNGVGDIPYNISGGNNQDRYPLIEPYGMTELTISMGSGLFKFSGVIKNIGNKTAFNVQWKITVDGGIILIGRESSGYLPRPLLAGEETSVSSGIVIGFGRIVITVSVWADNAPLVSKSIPGFLFLFFIKIHEGYRLTPMIYTGVFV